MIRRFFLVFISFLLAAAPGGEFASAESLYFNQNQIITDEELQDWQSLTAMDIQNFLTQKNGYLATWQTADEDGIIKSAAQIIARTSAEYKINPKYLLVKLQKEQSLITDISPSQKQLDWATGYGICDSCSMEDPALQKHKGFATQVDSAAAIMRWYYDHLATEAWIKRPWITYVIDGSVVIPENYATAFLYTYTPHIHGNKNFWRLWHEWFEQRYPDGTLVKSPESSTVYVIQNRKKRPIASMTVLQSRYNIQLLVTASLAELLRYETGNQVSLPAYSVLHAGEKYFLLDDDALRPFFNAEAVRTLGYHPDEIIEANEEDISAFTLGSTIFATSTPIARLLKIKETGSLYYLKEQTAYPLFDEKFALSMFPTLSIERVGSDALGDAALGGKVDLKDGLVLGAKDTGKVYVAEHGKLRHITSEEAFIKLGYKGSHIVWLPAHILASYEAGPPIAIYNPSVEMVSTP